MKFLLLVLTLICLAPNAIALTIAEAKSQLGLQPTAPGAPATEITVQMVNDAYAQTIRGLLEQVTTGNPGAVATSQQAAEARVFLLRQLRSDCEILLLPMSDKKEQSAQKSPPLLPDEEHLKTPWLHPLFPDLFPENFNPSDKAQLQSRLPFLVAEPKRTLELLSLVDHDVETRFPNFDPDSLTEFQQLLAYDLRTYLRPLRLSNPAPVRNFENAILTKMAQLNEQTDHLSRLLHSIGIINLTPGHLHVALVPLLEDPRVMIRAVAYGVLTRAAIGFGLPPNLEEALIHSPNDRALIVLAESKKMLKDETYQTMFARLSKVRDKAVLFAITDALLQNDSLRPAVLNALKAVRDSEEASAISRLIAARDLMDAKVDTEASEKYILSILPHALSDERFVLLSWCYNRSSNCSPQMRKAIEAMRIPQVHQKLQYEF